MGYNIRRIRRIHRILRAHPIRQPMAPIHHIHPSIYPGIHPIIHPLIHIPTLSTILITIPNPILTSLHTGAHIEGRPRNWPTGSGADCYLV